MNGRRTTTHHSFEGAGTLGWLGLVAVLVVAFAGVAVAQDADTASAAGSQVSLLGARTQETAADWPSRIRSGFGLLVMIGLAFAMSNGKRQISWRLVGMGVSLQLIGGVITLTPPGQAFFGYFNEVVSSMLGYTAEGSRFLFGNLAVQNNVPVGPSVVPMPAEGAAGWWVGAAKMAPVAAPSQGAWGWAPIGAYFAFGVLPTIIFFSSLMAVLYHLGVMQALVRGVAWLMQKTMRTSGSETLSAAGNIFVGQTEAPLLVRPFIAHMTESELMAVMTGGFATVAGGVMVAYVGILQGVFPDIAGHLLCASIMSAPAALVVAKIIIPEPDPTRSETFGTLRVDLKSPDVNVIDAAARGAGDGLKLALNVGAMLLAFIALIAMLNGMIGWLGGLFGQPGLSLQQILGVVLSPLAWVMGIPWEDSVAIGSLLGVKTVLNEFVAYLELAAIAPKLVHHRSMVIATYALCGFANFASIAIQIGGISPMAPERRSDLARIGLRAMIGGTLAAFMTACVIGMLT